MSFKADANTAEQFDGCAGNQWGHLFVRFQSNCIGGLGGQAKGHELDARVGWLGAARRLTQLFLPLTVRRPGHAFVSIELYDVHLRGRKSTQPFLRSLGSFGSGHGFCPFGQTKQNPLSKKPRLQRFWCTVMQHMCVSEVFSWPITKLQNVFGTPFFCLFSNSQSVPRQSTFPNQSR